MFVVIANPEAVESGEAGEAGEPGEPWPHQFSDRPNSNFSTLAYLFQFLDEACDFNQALHGLYE